MPTRQRYHIHVCLVRNEHSELENALQAALSDSYFLTWDLIAHPSNFMDYSRQQIDRCDYALFLLGNGYGHLSPSGVSFLHLSYIYAATKRKPMLALIKNRIGNVHFSRQRVDLANLIQKELGDNAIAFDLTQDAIGAAMSHLKDLTQREPVAGWQRAAVPTVTSIDNVLQPKPVGASSDYGNTTLLFSPTSSGVTTKSDSLKPNATAVTSVSVTTPHELDSLSLDDTVTVNYSAHAYQAGNLQDILATHTFYWAEIVMLLKQLSQPFSSDMMLKYINDSLKEAAMKEASKILPNVHAVSRCQITNADFQWIKSQLISNHWLIKDAMSRSNRELWRINTTV